MPGSTKAPAESSWQTGPVDGIQLGRLLFRIATDEETGVLEVSHRALWVKAFIRKGLLYDVKNNFSRGETLGNYLIQESIITPQEHKKSFERARVNRIPQGRVLVDMKILTERELVEYLTQHLTRSFLRAFSGMFDNGYYKFKDESFAIEGVAMRPVPLMRLLGDGYLTAAVCKHLNDVHAQKNQLTSSFRLTGRFQEIASQFNLNSRQIALARSFDGESLENLQQSNPEDFDHVLRLSSLLLATDALAFDDGLSDKPKPKTKGGPTRPRKPTPKEAPIEPSVSEDGENRRQLLKDAEHVFRQGDYAMAKVTLQKVLQTEPGNSRVRAMLAWTDFKLGGKGNAAIAESCKLILKQLVAQDPLNDLAHLFLGRIFKEENEDNLARDHFEQAYEANPSNEEAKREMKLVELQKRKRSTIS